MADFIKGSSRAVSGKDNTIDEWYSLIFARTHAIVYLKKKSDIELLCQIKDRFAFRDPVNAQATCSLIIYVQNFKENHSNKTLPFLSLCCQNSVSR